MRISADDLTQFKRSVGPPPPAIEPALPAAEEAAVIARAGAGRDPVVAARRARVLAIIRRPATPEGADAELVALLAASRALPLEREEDRLAARMRLVGIGRLAEPPDEVLRLMRKHRVSPGDGAAFADALMPKRHDGISPFHEGSSAGGLPPGL